MLGVVRRAALPLEARAIGEAMLGGEAVSSRRAAIVAGCARLMEADEEGSLGPTKSLRHDPIDAKIAVHKGRSVKNTGAGMLVGFANAVEAAPIAAG
jgi:class 3 adenylate cyclase